MYTFLSCHTWGIVSIDMLKVIEKMAKDKYPKSEHDQEVYINALREAFEKAYDYLQNHGEITAASLIGRLIFGLEYKADEKS